MTDGFVSAVLPTQAAIARLHPIDGARATLAAGFWGDRERINRERTLVHGFEQLQRAGNLDNLRLAAGAHGRYRSLGQAIGLNFPFLDSDVYKWLEAVGWELARGRDPGLEKAADEAIDAIAAAQQSDGYINSFVQVVAPGTQYQDLAWGHELYCLGHLIQAAVAWHRSIGDDRLLAIAVRAADSADRAFSTPDRPGLDGHPQVEMALVELYRTTAERRYLDLAARMIEQRGQGLLGEGRFGRAYWQDHAPVREADTVAGHAVRQLYLDCGAVDVATELGDRQLLEAVHRRWRDMVARHAYLTGGLGSRHNDESFGDPYELPPDRAYAETCAAIASVMLAWRLLLATGDPACAEAIERTAFNGVIAGVSLDGASFFYENPLQRRTERAPADSIDGHRASWYPCACCPPNLMRLMSSWAHYQATTDDGGVQLQQYAAGEIQASAGGGEVRLRTETNYPWTGRVTVTVVEAPPGPWALSLRLPAWSQSTCVTDVAGEERPMTGGGTWTSDARAWHAGDQVLLDIDMPARLTAPHPHVDAVRGCLAIERGPLVYCIETADLAAPGELEDVVLDPGTQPVERARPDVAPSVVGLDIPGAGSTGGVGAIPYYAWANRSVEAMRVWIPSRAGDAAVDSTAEGGG
jgi:DUF1680 family protein